MLGYASKDCFHLKSNEREELLDMNLITPAVCLVFVNKLYFSRTLALR
jgi:hypothetical protein